MEEDNVIIDNVDYLVDYQIDFDKENIGANVDGNYDNQVLKSSIYFSDNKAYILLNDVFDKYISYDVNYLNVLSKASDYREIITILNEEFNKLLKSKYFTRTNVEVNDEVVTKITLDLTKDYYNELEEILVGNLSENEKFMECYSSVLNDKYPKSELIFQLQKIDMSDYKISLYLTRFSNEFVKLEVESDEIDINIEKKDSKYSFQYYLRDGLIYEGFLKVEKGVIDEVNIVNNLDSYFVNLKFSELNIVYNEKVDAFNNTYKDNNVSHLELTEEDKKIIRKNEVVDSIYENYLNRYYFEMEEAEYEDDVMPPETKDYY